MPTASERMLELSALSSGNTARAHFLSIQQGSGQLNIYGEIEVGLMADLEVTIESDELNVEVESSDLVVELEPEIEIEVDC